MKLDILQSLENRGKLRRLVDKALKVIDNILGVIQRLEDFTDSGSRTPNDWLNEQGYSRVICKKHVAIYKIILLNMHYYDSQSILTANISFDNEYKDGDWNEICECEESGSLARNAGNVW